MRILWQKERAPTSFEFGLKVIADSPAFATLWLNTLGAAR
jgi:hypothetical protein